MIASIVQSHFFRTGTNALRAFGRPNGSVNVGPRKFFYFELTENRLDSRPMQRSFYLL